MQNIKFFNPTEPKCGVSIYGKKVMKSLSNWYTVEEIKYNNEIDIENAEDLIIINWHKSYLSQKKLLNILSYFHQKIIVISHNNSLISYLYENKIFFENKFFISHTNLSFKNHTYIIHPFDDIEVSYKIPENNINLCTFGFLMPHKNYFFMIQLLKYLVEKNINVTLTIFAAIHKHTPSNFLLRIQNLINHNNLQENIKIITQFIPDKELFLLLKDMHIGIFPTQNFINADEGSSGSVKNIISCGIPVFAFDIPIYNDVSNFITKILPCSPEYFGSIIVKNISNLDALHKKTLEYKKFTWEKIYNKNLLNDILRT